ncbi:MAG: ABC transporter permease [Rhodobacteraceae bacterium]|jgi:ABC-type dipeptide/oligopeptide/nickel transport system permease component|nr:ABC transporter permease [Paracoccaceae bacterium]
MLQTLLDRLLQTVVVLLFVSVIVFLLVRLIPGDPVDIFLGEATVSDEQRAMLRSEHGLDRPIIVQYGAFLAKAVQGDLGRSITQRVPVAELLGPAFLATIELVIAGTLLSVVVGVPIALLAAMRHGRTADQVTSALALFGYSMPTFWLGIMMILVLSVHLGWFPTGGRIAMSAGLERHTGLFVVDAIITGNMRALGSALQHLVLPSIALAAVSTASLMQVLRGSLISISQEEFVSALRARGLGRPTLWRHMLRNAAPPTVIIMGVRFGSLIGGGIVLETVFSWPGLGLLIIDAIRARDYPVVQGGVLVMAASFVIVSLVVDVIHILLDPRIRQGEAGR